ncbi:tetratricopeptide repeat protein [Streptomyces aureus]|uniref:tetratricopeptide repeat protein n=1 Tax=Streptomyces aureus TaxID=193461 RepID=UPI00131D5204|nr:tetratricopeptide repeat protein [Streptomyces aureus]
MAPPAPPARPESAPRPAPVRGPEPAVTAEFVPQPVSEAPVRPEARPEAAGFAAQAASEPSVRPEPGPAPVRRPEPAVTAEFVMQPVPEPVVRPDAQPVPEPVVRPEARSVPRPEAGARSVPRPEAAGFAGQSASEPSVRPEPGPAPVRRPEPAVTAEFVAQPAPPAPVPPVPAPPAAVPAPPVPAPVAGAEPASAGESGRDAGPAHGALARTPDPAPVPEAESVEPGVPTPSTFVLRAVPEPKPLPGSASTRVLRAVPESAAGSVAAPTGEFGPAPEATPAPEAKQAAPARKPSSPMEALSLLGPEPEPDPKPTPARGFDAVAEAVLAPSPQEPAADRDAASAFLAEPVARINEAVKMGRIEAAAGMAERAVAEAAQSLGHEHPEVLKLRELTAYIAYLAGDALRSFHLSLELARVRRRHRDNGAAYGNVQSAAAAWRAVRDPLQGLHLGRDLIGLWTELTADEGPAADDLEQLESARTRMVRLAERARLAGDMPYNRPSRAHGE